MPNVYYMVIYTILAMILEGVIPELLDMKNKKSNVQVKCIILSLNNFTQSNSVSW